MVHAISQPFLSIKCSCVLTYFLVDLLTNISLRWAEITFAWLWELLSQALSIKCDTVRPLQLRSSLFPLATWPHRTRHKQRPIPHGFLSLWQTSGKEKIFTQPLSQQNSGVQNERLIHWKVNTNLKIIKNVPGCQKGQKHLSFSFYSTFFYRTVATNSFSIFLRSTWIFFLIHLFTRAYIVWVISPP
jgi:hypothetical protein